jgi:hypothetical protein
MKIPAIFTNASDPTAYLSDEIGGTELEQAEVIEQLYLKADRSGAVTSLEAQGAEDAQRQPATLPTVELGVTGFDVTALAPAQ